MVGLVVLKTYDRFRPAWASATIFWYLPAELRFVLNRGRSGGGREIWLVAACFLGLWPNHPRLIDLRGPNRFRRELLNGEKVS